MQKASLTLSWVICMLLLSSCTFNPFSTANHPTGSPAGTAVGAGIGAGSAALLGGSKSMIGAAGLIGGAVGYYMTTLRYDAGGVMQSGGQVYTIGQYVGIYIPTDKLFEPNTSEFLPQANYILDSAADILKRNPKNNIIISGNTTGFGKRKWERKLSEERAAKVASYLWKAGVNNFQNPGITTRKLNYVGYGDFFPISSTDSNRGIRQNGRIQITSYPSDVDLHLDDRHKTLHNVGSLEDDVGKGEPSSSPCGNGKSGDSCYSL